MIIGLIKWEQGWPETHLKGGTNLKGGGSGVGRFVENGLADEFLHPEAEGVEGHFGAAVHFALADQVVQDFAELLLPVLSCVLLLQRYGFQRLYRLLV
jgi:hypothetical protein